jgi:hypothetical protein
MARSSVVRIGLGIAALVIGSAALLGAQTTDKEGTAPGGMIGYRGRWPFHLAVGGGLTLPIGDMSDLFDAGYNAQGSVIFRKRTWPVALRFDGLYSRHEMKSPVEAPGGIFGTTAHDGVGHLGAWTANLVLPFQTHGVGPYLIAGGGVYTTRFKTDVLGVSEHKVKSGFDGGAGFTFRLPALVDGYIEARFHSAYVDSELFEKERFNFIPITIGLVW